MSRPDAITEVVILEEPEDLDADRFSQPSVLDKAKKFQSVLAKYGSFREKLHGKGLIFGGRVLLLGAAGTDFESFVHHIAYETPLKIIRLRLTHAFGEAHQVSDAIRTLVEFAKRNSPAVIYIDKLDALAEKGKEYASVFLSALRETTWDQHEIAVVAATVFPERIEDEILTTFDRVFIFETIQMEERVKVLESLLEGRKDLDPTTLAEITEGWGFSDLVHLSVTLHTDVPEESNPIPRGKLEQILDSSGIIGISRSETRQRISRTTQGSHVPTYESIEHSYPDDFLDQLYLMAVGDDFQGTQRVIESLNASLPLAPADAEFLSRYPFLLTGNAEDRLTRLMRAKRTSDRLSRIMGR
ncbi:MAG: AAA family ATPase [Candidatus Thorarchaeota archaeon]